MNDRRSGRQQKRRPEPFRAYDKAVPAGYPATCNPVSSDVNTAIEPANCPPDAFTGASPAVFPVKIIPPRPIVENR